MWLIVYLLSIPAAGSEILISFLRLDICPLFSLLCRLRWWTCHSANHIVMSSVRSKVCAPPTGIRPPSIWVASLRGCLILRETKHQIKKERIFEMLQQWNHIDITKK